VIEGAQVFPPSDVAGGFLHQLHTGGESEFGIDVGEVGLHGARRDEQTRGNVCVGQPFADESDDVALCRGERLPPAGRSAALTAAALRVGDCVFGGQARAVGPRGVKLLLPQGVSKCGHCAVVSGW
jgi:hypothetical protein